MFTGKEKCIFCKVNVSLEVSLPLEFRIGIALAIAA